MSTIPPPYQYDPKAQRRAAALQARALRDSYKAQRDLFRQQHRQLRRGSILGPMLLVGFGIIALLVSTGHWSALAFAAVYARWWPALLVLAGLVLLAEWAYDQYLTQNPNPAAPAQPVRRRIGGGIVFLLILLGVVGVTSRTAHDQRDFLTNAFSINHENLAELLGDKHVLPPQILDETIPTLTPGLTLSIDNPHGDIEIVGKSNDGNLHITVNKQLYSSTTSDLETRGDRLTPQFVASPNGLSLTVPSVDGGSADLSLLVPESLALSISARRGDIKVTGLKAPVSINAYGNVELQSITGAVTSRLGHSESTFAATSITGDLTLKGSAGDVNLSEISGQTYLEGDFYGDTHFEHLNGPVTFQTSKTHFTLARVPGNLDINHSNISGSDIAGPISLRVHSRNISLDNITGDLDLSNSNGTVNLTTSRPGNLTVANTNGSVDITVPDRTGLAITAEARSGTIDDDFALSTTKSGDRTSLSGTIGDGKNHVNLQTTHANIFLHKSQPTTSAPH